MSDITNDNTVVVAVVVRAMRAVAMVLLVVLVASIFETTKGGGVMCSTTNASYFGLLDNGAAVGVESGIAKVATGLAVTVAVAALAVAAPVVEGFAGMGDLGLLNDSVAVTTVDYSVITKAVTVAVANDRVALVQGLTEIAAGIFVHSAGGTRLAKVFHSVSLVSPLVGSINGADNGLTIMPMGAVSVTVIVRTIGLVHEICSG